MHDFKRKEKTEDMGTTKTDDCIPKSDNKTRTRLGVYTNTKAETTIFAEET